VRSHSCSSRSDSLGEARNGLPLPFLCELSPCALAVIPPNFLPLRPLKMKSFRYVHVLHQISSVAFSSLITAPATGFFILFMLFGFNHSLADTFLEQARSLTGDAPPGMVRECKQSNDSGPPSPLVMPQVCKTVLIDEDDWKERVDDTIRQFYLTFSVFGLLFWMTANNQPSELIGWIRRKCKQQN
jgi:hypothetical protein